MSENFICIMTSKSFPDFVRIVVSADPEKCRKDLSNSIPYEYELYATYRTSKNLDEEKLYKMIDIINPSLRLKDKFLFKISPQQAFDILKAIATISGSLKRLIKGDLPEKRVNNKKNYRNRFRLQNPKLYRRNPPINFFECGIKRGEKLVYKEDPSIVVTVHNERKVLYNDEETSLSAIVADLKGITKARGPEFFTYNGRSLVDIARKNQWSEFKKYRKKKSAINFLKCGIEVGAKLVYTEDPSVVVTVVNDRKVLYNNKETSLSAIVADLKGTKSARGPEFFTYNGRSLVEIAKKTQWKR